MSESLERADIETLKAVFDEARRERDRLRAARAWASRQLGPLPAAAGLSTGIVAAVSGHVVHGWLYGALAGLLVMVIVGILYSSMQSYRQIRAAKTDGWRRRLAEARPDLAEAAERHRVTLEDLLPEKEWYAEMITRERELYGPERERNRYGLPRRRPEDLQDAFDRERTGLFTVQILFVVVIACLVLSRLT